MSDTNQDQFDPDYSIAEKLQAEVLEENPETFFVQFDEDHGDILPRSTLNELIFGADEEIKDDMYDLLVYGEPLTFEWTKPGTRSLSSWLGGEEQELRLHAEDGGRYFEIEHDGTTTPVPSSLREQVIETITDDKSLVGQRLADLQQEIEENYVDRSKVQAFLDRFPSPNRVRPSRDGWLVDGSFVVRYDATNWLVDDPGTFQRKGSEVTPTDEEKQFLPDLDFGIDSGRTVETSGGQEIDLSVRELRFLATVEVLVNPERYLGHDQAGRVIEERDIEDTEDDEISSVASGAGYSSFKEPGTGQVHGHTMEKHTLTSSFGVTQEVLDRLHFAQNGHAGVNELARREREFSRADFDVFRDTNNDDPERWREIKKHAKGAPISDRTQRQMDSMFGTV